MHDGRECGAAFNGQNATENAMTHARPHARQFLVGAAMNVCLLACVGATFIGAFAPLLG